MEITIVTGLSGAGKSQAVNALEDIGFFCIDNMPPTLIPKFVEMSLQSHKSSRLAVVTDVRTGEMFGGFFAALDELCAADVSYKILFLDARDDILIKRYSESRRKHPLAGESISTAEAIQDERARLKPVFEMADYHIDTTYISNQQLRDRVVSLFLSDTNTAIRVRCISFGFKYGIPNEADLLFDVRFLPNPFYVDELKTKTGLSSEVSDYVIDNALTTEFLDKLYHLLDFLLPLYRTEGKSQLMIGIGCTGGKHRSVTIAEILSKHITAIGFDCLAMHRDINKSNT